MNKIKALKDSLNGIFVAAGLTYIGLIPQETPYDPEQDVSANDTQLSLFKKIDTVS